MPVQRLPGQSENFFAAPFPPSTKERFVLPSRKINSFIAGEYTSSMFVDDLARNPKFTPEAVAHQKELFHVWLSDGAAPQ